MRGGIVNMCGDSGSLGGQAADELVLAAGAAATRRAGSRYPSRRRACSAALMAMVCL